MTAVTTEATPEAATTARERAAVARADRYARWQLGGPFVLAHLSCLLVIVVGWSPVAVGVAVGMYLIRMFGITGFYHRYFSHRAFQTSRGVQLVGAILGAAAAQKGPLWWAAHHRRHHRATDRPGDPHSPIQDGFLVSHVLWIFARANRDTNRELIEDFSAYPELRFIDRFHHLVPALTIGTLFGLGVGLGHAFPSLHTSGPQMAVWGFSISTLVLWHATFAVNSVGHLIGKRRYDTTDGSRNNVVVAMATLGEGWHNNHHRFPGAARQGFSRFELDVTYLVLRGLAACRLIRDLRPVPAPVMAIARGSQSE